MDAFEWWSNIELKIVNKLYCTYEVCHGVYYILLRFIILNIVIRQFELT